MKKQFILIIALVIVMLVVNCLIFTAYLDKRYPLPTYETTKIETTETEKNTKNIVKEDKYAEEKVKNSQLWNALSQHYSNNAEIKYIEENKNIFVKLSLSEVHEWISEATVRVFDSEFEFLSNTIAEYDDYPEIECIVTVEDKNNNLLYCRASDDDTLYFFKVQPQQPQTVEKIPFINSSVWNYICDEFSEAKGYFTDYVEDGEKSHVIIMYGRNDLYGQPSKEFTDLIDELCNYVNKEISNGGYPEIGCQFCVVDAYYQICYSVAELPDILTRKGN